jgi:hypothetical protein
LKLLTQFLLGDAPFLPKPFQVAAKVSITPYFLFHYHSLPIIFGSVKIPLISMQTLVEMKSAGNRGVLQNSLQVPHIHVLLVAPLSAGDMAQPGSKSCVIHKLDTATGFANQFLLLLAWVESELVGFLCRIGTIISYFCAFYIDIGKN